MARRATSPKVEPETKRVGIWIRVSTDDQARGESPEHHEKRARYYAESKGWNVVELYDLAGVSGKAVLEHPEAKRMLADMKRGHITGLIFSKLARLARNTRELLDIADLFRDGDADLISLGEAIDTSSPAGRLFFTMIAAMAQFEREEIASRVAASVPIRAKLGKSLGGPPPFGYQYVDKKLVPDPTQVPVVKRLFELFVEHRRKRTVAGILNEEGHRTRTGEKFSDTTVGRILRDSVAKGTRRVNYNRWTDKKRWVRKPESEWVYVTVEPIVSAEVFDQANAILETQAPKKNRLAKKPVHLFAGVTVCGCGNKMYVPSNTPKYVCYKCRNKIPIEDLEAVFHEQLREFVFAPDEIDRYFLASDELIRDKGERLLVLERDLERAEKARRHVLQLHLDGHIDQDQFVRDHGPLGERVRQLEVQIPELQGEIDFLKIQRLSGDQILTEARDLHGRWRDLGRDEKRHVIEQVTSQIRVLDGEIEIDLCYLPSSHQELAKWQRDLGHTLPFCHLTLRAGKPKDSRYPKRFRTVGDRLKARRLDLGLLQRDVAANLGVSSSSVRDWELGHKTPKLQHRPALHAFLGEEPPREIPTTFAEGLRVARRAMGLSRRRLAELVGFGCPDTIADWEHGVRRPMPRHLDLLRKFFDKVGQPLGFVDQAAADGSARRREGARKAWVTRRRRVGP